jgi:1-phosphofructokinase
VELKEKEEIIVYAKKLKKAGAENVLVSMAGDGAILIGEDDQVYESQAPKGTVVNSVGAGDSMVAGFLYGYLNAADQLRLKQGFRTGIAAGSASAFSDKLATKEEVVALLSCF